MKLTLSKYHALGNSFLVAETSSPVRKIVWSKLANAACNAATGIGADGLLVLSKASRGNIRADVFNADGSWAERSGNGLRIAALHCFLSKKAQRTFAILMGGTLCQVRIGKRTNAGYLVACEIGVPDFRTAQVPVRSRLRHLINQQIAVGRRTVRATCLSVGNPHCVLAVEDFDFDWKTLGAQIEHAPIFPKRTNVEFVRVLNRRKLRVAEWERGAGATGSSGTGAAAAVAALVMLGKADRECKVQFTDGDIAVHWRAETDRIEIEGPIVHILTARISL